VLRLPLITPEPRHAHRSAQFPGLCLLTCNRVRSLETGFGFCCIRLWRHQGDFASDAINPSSDTRWDVSANPKLPISDVSLAFN